MKDTFTNSIIKDFSRFYNYGIIELNGNNPSSRWALVKSTYENKKRVIMFVENENGLSYEEVTNYLKEVLNIVEVDLVRINIRTSNSFEPESYEFKKQAEIILDPESKKVEVNNADYNEVAQELLNIINNLNNEKEGRKLYKNNITIILISINIIMYIITAYLSGNILDSNINVLISLGAKNNELIAAGEYYRLIACMFLHGGLLHLGLNMYSLYSIGPLVETVYGKIKYTALYFISGIAASTASYFLSESTSIGASGAIFGLLGATLIFAVKMRKNLGKDFLRSIVIVIAINLYIGLNIQGIDNFAHLGGLLGGIGMGLLFYNTKKHEA